MLKLRRKVLEQIYHTVRKQTLRNCSAPALVDAKISTREKLWRQAQQKYAAHPTILYSSHLESQLEYMPHWTRKTMEAKLRRRRGVEQLAASPTGLYPAHWMEDYEFYEGAMDADGNLNSTHGTADPAVPPSKVLCSGCGANLHCASVSLPGYIPAEIFKGRTNDELRTIICQRCHFLKNYNIALDVEVTPESYVDTISRIKDEFALAILIVDLLDFPCSIWPGMQQLLGPKRPIFVVGNKVDLLPRDSNGYLERIQDSLKDEMVQCGFDALNIKYTSLISAKTGYGIEELITQLHKIWQYKGNVYLMGCTNVGKSSLFNILLNSDYCRPEATDLVRKATVCPWPGTTLQMLKFPILRPSDIRIYRRFRRLFSERAQKAAEEKLQRDQMRKGLKPKSAQLIGNVGRTFIQREETIDAFSMSRGTQPVVTLNERREEYKKARWCYDTPGVIHPDQLTNLLTTEELLAVQPNEMIRPRAFRFKRGMSVFIAGLARLDFVGSTDTNYDWIKIFIFCSLQLPVVISPTVQADEMYTKYLGTELLGVPHGCGERMARWPGLHCKKEELVVLHDRADAEDIDEDSGRLTCDIMLSSAGWIGLRTPYGVECTFKAWTPHAGGIYVRTPPLIPYAGRLVGKHIRNSLAYNLAKPFVFRK